MLCIRAGVLEDIRDTGKALLFVGWGGDLATGERAEHVAIFTGDRLSALVAPNLERPDLDWAVVGRSALVGFRVQVPRASAGQIDRRAVRAFALFANRTARELHIASRVRGKK